MRDRGEAGLTLVETGTATMLLGLVLALVVPFVSDSTTTLSRQQERVDTNDQLHLAMAQIERDVRSGNIIGEPGAVDGLPGMQVRMYTQTDGVPFTCVEYRVSDGVLQRRSRQPGVGIAWPEAWRAVAEGVANATQTPAVPVFTKSADRQTLAASLVIRRAAQTDSAVRLDTAITGRNTKYYDTPLTENPCT